jgi:ribosomal protein S18 acetylase RimI-like enzyme
MPQVRRKDVPPQLLQHLLERIQERRIDAKQLELLAEWLDAAPEVPEGPWYKKLSGMTVCGEGELIKTFLLPGQAPKGERLR